jgi:hypothetical protein
MNKTSQSTYVVCQFAGSVGNVIVASIGDPPRVTLKGCGDGAMQFLTMTNVDFLVQAAMNDHHWTLHLFDSINVGVYIQASQCSAERSRQKSKASAKGRSVQTQVRRRYRQLTLQQSYRLGVSTRMPLVKGLCNTKPPTVSSGLAAR